MSDPGRLIVRRFFYAWGALSGLLALLAWRFISPPNFGNFTVPNEPQIIVNGDMSIRISEAVIFPSTPAWVMLPLIGILAGVFVSLAATLIGVRFQLRRERRTTTTWLLCGALGALTGLAAAGVLQVLPPSVFLVPGTAGATGFPPQLNLDPIWLTLPLMGMLLGAGAAAAVIWGGAAFVIDRGSASAHSARHDGRTD